MIRDRRGSNICILDIVKLVGIVTYLKGSVDQVVSKKNYVLMRNLQNK